MTRRAARGAPASLAAGVLLAHFLFFFDLGVWAAVAALLALAVFRRSALPALAVVALGWATFVLQSRLADRLDPSLSGSTLSITGRIDGLPEVYGEFTRFRFRPDAGQLAGPEKDQLPHTLLTYWYQHPPELVPGESWQLVLLLKPPWGRINFSGSDRELWLFTERIGGLATVRSGTRLQDQTGTAPGWHEARHAIRSRLKPADADDPGRGVVEALAIADRGSLTPRQREILAKTGTAHLLSISGLHVSLAAIFGFWLARVLLMVVPHSWTAGKAHPASLLAGLATATLYAALAGFGTATVRSLVMLAVGILALMSRRAVHPGQAITLAFALVLILDPPAALSAAFWLSFVAVGVLLFLFAGGGRADQGWWRAMLHAQAGIMLVMLPLGAWWFQSMSPYGFLANLLAIPWVSVIVVPLVLLAMLLMPLSATLSALVFSLASNASTLLMVVLGALADLPSSSLALVQPSLWLVALSSLGGALLLLPRGMRHRWLGLLMLLPLFSIALPPPEQQIQLEVMDVGQGTAMLVNSHQHLLLYDSGPGDGEEFDLVDQVIAPAVLQSGHRSPDRILISHGDLDHAGGLGRLRKRFPAAVINASLPESLAGIEDCDDELRWAWDGIAFRVLNPSGYLPYLGNDSSCVLSLVTNRFSILLPGDISSAIEHRLLKDWTGTVDFLLVPHHGSKTSSSTEFLRALRPGIAVATTGLGNRFGFPRPEVRQRYLDAGITFWSTGVCGAIRLVLGEDGRIEARSARRVRTAPWRWPVDPSCP